MRDEISDLKTALLREESRLENIEDLLKLLLVQNMTDECAALLEDLQKVTNIHIFFNCDEAKSTSSMNIMYNKKAYRDSAAGRRALMEQIVKENAARKICIRAEDMKVVMSAVIDGQPTDATKYIKYGAIVTLPLWG